MPTAFCHDHLAGREEMVHAGPQFSRQSLTSVGSPNTSSPEAKSSLDFPLFAAAFNPYAQPTTAGRACPRGAPGARCCPACRTPRRAPAAYHLGGQGPCRRLSPRRYLFLRLWLARACLGTPLRGSLPHPLARAAAPTRGFHRSADDLILCRRSLFGPAAPSGLVGPDRPHRAVVAMDVGRQPWACNGNTFGRRTKTCGGNLPPRYCGVRRCLRLGFALRAVLVREHRRGDSTRDAPLRSLRAAHRARILPCRLRSGRIGAVCREWHRTIRPTIAHAMGADGVDACRRPRHPRPCRACLDQWHGELDHAPPTLPASTPRCCPDRTACRHRSADTDGAMAANPGPGVGPRRLLHRLLRHLFRRRLDAEQDSARVLPSAPRSSSASTSILADSQTSAWPIHLHGRWTSSKTPGPIAARSSSSMAPRAVPRVPWTC